MFAMRGVCICVMASLYGASGYHFASVPFQTQHSSTPAVPVVVAPTLLPEVVGHAPVGITQNSPPTLLFAVAAPLTPMAPLVAKVNDVAAVVPVSLITGPAIGCVAADAEELKYVPNGRNGLLKPGVQVSEVGLQYHW